jgi:CubicO group peptidase (beta-lactamase class C family)
MARAWQRGAAAADLIQNLVREGKLESACLLVRDGAGTVILEQAFGAAKSIDAKFLIASITKPMTAAGVMKLVDKGKLKLEDPASRYLPEFTGGDWGRITIRHLLTHTSGLPDMLPENTELRRRNAPLSEFVALSLKTPLLFAPGTKTSYASMAILLASEIAHRIDGRAFPKYLEEELYRPLGMANTALGLGKFQLKETVRSQVEFADPTLGASPDAKSWDWNSPYWRNLATPWGGAHSTVGDIDRFLRAFLQPDGRLLRKETAANMIRNQNMGLNQPYGIGWAVGRTFGKNCSPATFGHGGSTGTLCWADPANGRTFVLLTSLPDRVARKLVIGPVSDMMS